MKFGGNVSKSIGDIGYYEVVGASYILCSSYSANHVLFIIVRMFVGTKECSNLWLSCVFLVGIKGG
jgi:hypothetical protein